MSWQGSLVRIAEHEVEEVRKRLVAILETRSMAELKLVMLHAETEAETMRASQDVEAGWYRLGYLEGWRLRRDAAQAEIAATEAEEAGCRDALAEAFENLKKYEQVAETARVGAVRERARLERIDLDELGQRAAARR